MKKLVKIILWIILIYIIICLLTINYLSVNFEVSTKDLILYRISEFLLFLVIGIGILFELDIFHIKNKIPLLKSSSILNHIIFWVILFLIAGIVFLVPYNLTSSEFKVKLSQESQEQNKKNKINPNDEPKIAEQKKKSKETNQNNISTSPKNNQKNMDTVTWISFSKNSNRYKAVMTLLGENFRYGKYSSIIKNALKSDVEKQLVKNLFAYYHSTGKLPIDFQKAFTKFCVGEEYKNMFFEGDNNPFYDSLSYSFQISWKSDDTYYIDLRTSSDEENSDTQSGTIIESEPLTYTFDNSSDKVGDCTLTLNEVQLINKPHKMGSYLVVIRIYATVKNNLSKDTYISANHGSGNIVGIYHGKEGDEYISGNSILTWEGDTHKTHDSYFSLGYNLKPKQEKKMKIQCLYFSKEPLKYEDKPYIDLFFTSNAETLTISINKE